MEHYTLQPDEAVLYRGEAQVKQDGKNIKTELLLTDKFFVFIGKEKKLFRKEEITVESFAVDTVKTYKDAPNIIRKGEFVEIYFIGGEKFIEFSSKGDAKQFVAKALEFLTNKSALIRGIDKTKKVVSDVGDSLGIDKETAATVAVGAAKFGVKALFQKRLGGKTKLIETTETVKSSQGIFHRKETKQLPPMSPQEQAQAVIQLKELLDNGVITQEEFEIKKKEYLGL